MKRELRDELEVPGTVIRFEVITKKQAIDGIKEILATAEKRGCVKLKELNQDEKQRIKEYFDALRLPHNDLED